MIIMTNAKYELLSALKNQGSPTMLMASIEYEQNYTKKHCFEYDIFTGDLRAFLDSLDFEYDGKYGSQDLYGDVLLSNGIKLAREEYDGSEWWHGADALGVDEKKYLNNLTLQQCKSILNFDCRFLRIMPASKIATALRLKGYDAQEIGNTFKLIETDTDENLMLVTECII